MRVAMLTRPVSLVVLLVVLGATCAGPFAPAPLQAQAPFTWWMEERMDLGWLSYDEDAHAYEPSYLYPQGWEVGFDVCGRAIARGVTSLAWSIERAASGFSWSVAGAPCRLDRASTPPAPLLPSQGDYVVTITAPGGAKVSGTITVRDLLIVSIGDSNASGEGNPHNFITPELPDRRWIDTRCHRSIFPGHAQAAAQIEAGDPHSAVTFISFACSGAEVMGGLLLPYLGIQLPGGLAAAAAALRPG